MLKLAIFVSGGGTTLQRVIDACKSGELDAKINIVISNTKKAYGLKRAEQAGIKTYIIPKESDSLDIVDILKQNDVNFVVLAGYLKKIPSELIQEYNHRMINLHPALLPKFGGKGMYGDNVHMAVIKAGEKQSGSTVHYVDKGYDTGNIIKQCFVDIDEEDTPETLKEKVMAEEKELLVEVLKSIVKGELN